MIWGISEGNFYGPVDSVNPPCRGLYDVGMVCSVIFWVRERTLNSYMAGYGGMRKNQPRIIAVGFLLFPYPTLPLPNLMPYPLPPIFLHRLYPSLLTEHPISAKTRGIIDSQVRFASLPTCSAETATTWQPATVRLGVYIS